MKFWQTKEFKSLQSEWYSRLAASGFVDVERKIGEEDALIQNSANVYRQAPAVIRDAKQEYFLTIAKNAAEEVFDKESDFIIMTKHGEGLSIEEITDILQAKKLKCHRQTVRYVIRRYEMRWNIKEYS